MRCDEERTAMKTIVGGIHLITDAVWALSLIRRLGEEEAFLLLEGISDAKRFAIKIDLKCKPESNNTKAEIVFREINIAELVHLGSNCHSFTWHLSDEKGKALLELIEAEKLRGEAGLINYVMLGNTKVAGSVAGSTEALGLYASLNASQVSVQERRENIDKQLKLMPEQSAKRWRLLASHISVESVDMLLRHGHNCYSWSVQIIKAIGLEYNESFFKKLIICNPVPAIEGNTMGEDEDSTRSYCAIL